MKNKSKHTQLISEIRIISTRSFSEIEKVLRNVHLVGDPTILPYQKAKISSTVMYLEDINPISLYVIQSRLSIQKNLYKVFKRDYEIDIFDMDGHTPDVTFQVKNEKGFWSMAPPIVEESQIDQGKILLIDGEHRFYLARKMGIEKIRCIKITDIPIDYPTVALPITWDKVKVYENVPELTKKRHFRYNSIHIFPDISKFSDVTVSKEDFRYFFYRDLSPICTSGIR